MSSFEANRALLVPLGVLGIGLALGLHLSRRARGLTIPVLFGFGLLMGQNALGLLVADDFLHGATEVGLLLMLFYTSLFGNPRALRDGGRIGLPLAAYDLVVNFAIAWWVGDLLGWEVRDRLFFAGIIATSSTAVVLKILGDEGRVSRREGNVLLSLLFIEDWVFLGFYAFLGWRYGDLIARPWHLVALGIFGFIVFLAVLRMLSHTIWSIQNKELLIVVLTSIGILGAYLGMNAGLPGVGSAFTTGLILSGEQGAQLIQKEAPYLRDAAAALFFVGYAALLGPTLSLDVLPLLGLAIGGIFVSQLLFLPVMARRLGLRRSESFVAGALLLPRAGKSAAFAKLYPVTPGAPPLFPLAGLLAVVLTPLAPLVAKIGIRLAGRRQRLPYTHASEEFSRSARSLLLPHAYLPRNREQGLQRFVFLELVILEGLLAIATVLAPRPWNFVVGAALLAGMVPLVMMLRERVRVAPRNPYASHAGRRAHERIVAFDHLPYLLAAPLGLLFVLAVLSPWTFYAYPAVLGAMWLGALVLPWLRPTDRRAPPLSRAFPA